VILEAMACGRPYVVTASQGLEGYLRHGHDGLVVPPGDVDAFARAIRALLDDPERADAMGRAGRARLERELTTGVQAKHLAEVIKEVVR
jgi:glycosyltransferase involved in cell wall biosynthesis